MFLSAVPGQVDQRLESSGNKLRSPDRWTAALIVVLCVGTVFATHAAYLDAFATNDDLYLQLEMGYVATGHTSLATYAANDYNGQLFPLFKLMYYAAWRAFGLAPEPWHAANLLAHAASAVLLFWLLRNAGLHAFAAAVGGLLWASAAIGRWDNPLIWICGGAIVWSTMWLLAAIGIATRPHGNGSRASATGMALVLTASMTTWGVMGMLSPLVPVARWLSGAGSTGRPPGWLRWFIAWGVPVVAFGLWQAAVARSSFRAPPAYSVRANLAEASFFEPAIRAGMQMLASLSGVTLCIDSAQQEGKGLIVGAVLAVAVLAGLWRAPPIGRRLALLLLAGAAGYLIVAHAMRTDVTRTEALAWGRYRYLPTLAWCAALGVAVGSVTGRERRGGRIAALAVTLVLLAIIAANRRLAVATAADFRRVRGPLHEVYQANVRLLDSLNSMGNRRGRTLRFPQIPVDLPPVRNVQFPLSSFIALKRRHGLPGIQVVVAERLQAADVRRVQAALGSLSNPRARQWSALVRDAVHTQGLVVWLSRFARANGLVVRLPREMAVQLGPRSNRLSFTLAQFIADGFASPPDRIEFVSPAELPQDGVTRTVRLLGESNDPRAGYWLTVFRRLDRRG